MICKNCQNEILGSEKKFCCRRCYEEYRRRVPDKRSSKFIETQRTNSREFYNNPLNNETNIRRRENIQKTRFSRSNVILSEEKYSYVKYVLSLKYVNDVSSLIKICQLDLSYNEFIRFVEHNSELLILFKSIKHTRKCLRTFDPERFNQLRLDSQKYDHRYIEKKYNLTEINFYCVCQYHTDIVWKRIEEDHRRKETYIEKIVRNILVESGVDFQKEKYLVHRKFRVDCLIGKKVIEVNGDYWHCNPDVYDREDLKNLSVAQKDNMIRDTLKQEWIEENDYKLLIVWERDINLRINWVKEQIKNFLKDD